MTAWILALALAAAPVPEVAVFPLQHPAGRTVQAEALGDVLRASLGTRATLRMGARSEPASGCTDEACLRVQHDLARREHVVVPAWTIFGEGAVVSARVYNVLTNETFTVSRSASNEAGLPLATSALATEIADRLALPVVGAAPDAEDHPSFGLTLKLGNAFGTFSSSTNVRNLNLRFDLEGDYLAAPEFWPFVDVALVLARDTSGQQVKLLPVLLGAKYVFRRAQALRPFVGMGLGLGFLSTSLDAQTGSSASFAVYGVTGVNYFVRPEIALLAEASLNLNGLEASGGAGVLFALSFNLGVVVLF
jgi:hypothetical protein